MLIRTNRSLRIATIVDTFTEESLAPEADLVPVTPKNWLWSLKFKKPDLLFVESVWRGHKNSWQGRVASYPNKPKTDTTLIRILEYCDKNHIPTVFWNKEDPEHFDRFKNVAKFCKHVYTTDENCIESYRKIHGSVIEHIDVLSFAAQPRIHSPPTHQRKRNGIAFLGGYYGNDLPCRSKTTCNLLDGLTQCDLTIYDRFYINGNRSSFPQKYKNHIKAGLNYQQVAKKYKEYPVYLNINTITDSPTMLSRRVFELAASGSCIISNPSLAMRKLFNGIIPEVETSTEAREQYNEMISNSVKRNEISQNLLDTVLNAHTWQHRIQHIKK